MHLCIVGTGLSGCLLAWRLSAAGRGVRVDLVGTGRPTDATAASGGLVRGFEPDQAACEAAAESLAELRGSAVLRAWADYHEVGSTYVSAADSPALRAGLATVRAHLPNSARVVDAGRLGARARWAGLPDTAVAVVEQRAGYVSPGALRDAVLADVLHRGAALHETAVAEVRPTGDGGAEVVTAGGTRAYDAVVVAAGPWTGALLGRGDLPTEGYRVRAVQYAVHDAAGVLPSPFVDGTSGLYGRLDGLDRILVGLPTQRWGVDPAAVPADPALAREAARLVAARFPRLRLGPRRRIVVAADCYTDPAGLRLRITVPGHRLYTFTGGSGGAARTALSAARTAADALLADSAAPRPGAPVPVPAYAVP